MDMNTATLPKKGLKKYDYNIDMKDHIATLPKKGLKTGPYNIDMEKMEKKDLKKLTKGQLIELLLKKEKKPKVVIVDDTKPTRPTPLPRTGKWENLKPKPVPRKSVKQMVKEYEDIIQPPDGYKPIPKPRTDRPLQMRRPPKPTRKPPPPPIPQVEDHIINVPVPKIKELNKALKGHAKSYGIELQDNSDPLNQFTKTKELVKSHLGNLLKDMKGFKFIETLEITFEKKPIDSKTVSIFKTAFLKTLEMTFEKDSIDSKTGKRVSIYKTAFFNSKAKTITKADDIEHELNMSRQEILKLIDIWVSEGSGWVIDRIDSHYINVTKYKPLHGSNYIELPTGLKNPKKGLINIKNKDDECFR